MRWVKPLLITLVVIVVLVGGGIFYLKSAAEARFEKTHPVTVAPIPIPFPLTSAEIEELKRRAARKAAPAEPGATAEEGAEPADVAPAQGEAAPAEAGAPAAKLDFAAIANQRAVRRGKHYLESRAGCAECHGEDFGGKVLVDSALVGTWSAPNITRGGVVKNYKPEDWVRVVRHGLKPNGKPAAMPSQLYTSFSDQEISDIAAYLRSLPPIERASVPSKLGPLMWFRVVKGDVRLSAEHIDHAAARPKSPPSTLKASAELGKHITSVCSACHGTDLAGGRIAGGGPDWPPAKNLTFHATGLEKWSLADFTKALREGTRPDGNKLDRTMPVQYTKNLKDTEIESIYTYLKAVPPKQTPAS